VRDLRSLTSAGASQEIALPRVNEFSVIPFPWAWKNPGAEARMICQLAG
jgi:hypothetical protein